MALAQRYDWPLRQGNARGGFYDTGFALPTKGGRERLPLPLWFSFPGHWVIARLSLKVALMAIGFRMGFLETSSTRLTMELKTILAAQTCTLPSMLSQT